MYPLPLSLLLFCQLALATASPSPARISSDFAMSLVPRNTLFYRQMKDLQTFDSALGGVRASSIMNSGIPDRPFAVEGNNFPNFATAAQRSCDEQFQGCQAMANSQGNGGRGKGKAKGRDSGGELTVTMCDQQKEKCNQAQQTAKVQDFQTGVASTNIGPDPLFPDFDLICEG
ncbi:hypothetical protein BU25DRAFT_423387 [Macroventuria anomochaeta]|uniref:Uncharacterized protein n=1 Tax=Macroventuria anomochaeta TaxID=301207 RepID=A0ACB6RTR6_9PLEO|nr:uncharacterized protein BU25DRAFT_423387 [Macroventuria anomochaeta]KAF2625306.1 hypothetical protein BU25DRAFT_423387 [Macroventuria anomochaeta]